MNGTRKGCKNLTWTQRLQIEALFNAKISKQQIADTIEVSVRTIYRELKRGAYEHTTSYIDYGMQRKYRKHIRYSPNIAQNKSDLAMTSKGAPLKIGNDFAFVHYVEKRVLQDKLTPCAVLGEIKRNRLFATQISKTTLYRYISIGIFENLSMENLAKKSVRRAR